MKKIILLSLITLLSACTKKQPPVEMIAFVDHSGVTPNMSVWLNEEPLTVLCAEASYPRLANSYPLKKGTNQLLIKSETDAPLKEGGIGATVFFKKNEAETEIPLTLDPAGGHYQGTFIAGGGYQIPGATPAPATSETIDQARLWTKTLLARLAAKDAAGLSALFHDDKPVRESWQPLLKPDMELRHLARENEIKALKGPTIVLIYADDRLTEWRRGDATISHHEFMFRNTTTGLHLRIEENTWLKCRIPLPENDGKTIKSAQ